MTSEKCGTTKDAKGNAVSISAITSMYERKMYAINPTMLARGVGNSTPPILAKSVASIA
jgi:hypothetical protein